MLNFNRMAYGRYKYVNGGKIVFFDFEDVKINPRIIDFAMFSAIGNLIGKSIDPSAIFSRILTSFFDGYRSVSEVTEEEERVLPYMELLLIFQNILEQYRQRHNYGSMTMIYKINTDLRQIKELVKKYD